MQTTSRSPEATLELGARLARLLSPGDVVCLEGELGTGKTVLVRGIARGLGFDGPVQSPTFTIIHLYPEQRLCHVDAFRLSGPGDLIDAGIEEYLEGDWICAVEWAERVRAALPADALTARLTFGRGEEDRIIEFVGPAGPEDLRMLAGGAG